jgi:hypothetical protein
MPEPRNLRARSFAAFGWLAMLLAAVGTVSISVENVSFGHEHLDAGHALHHHHVYLGSHEHPQDGHGDNHDHGAPAPQERDSHPGTVTVSVSPALFQPSPAGVVVAGPAESMPLLPDLAPLPEARRALEPSPPRGPPLSIAGRGSLDQH